MSMHKYQRAVTPGPDGTELRFRNTETDGAIELAELDGWYYVCVPDGVTMPDQQPEIQWQAVEPNAAIKEQIKAASRPCQLIYAEMQRRIRDAYPIEVEQYYARIGVGAALGLYVFQPGEQEALVAFGAYVEAVRQWGKSERAKIGL